MKAPITFATALLAMLAVTSPAMARDGRHDRGHDGDRDQHGYDRRHDSDRRDYARHDDRRHDNGRHNGWDRDDRYRNRDRYVAVPGWRNPGYRVPPRVVYRPAPRVVYRSYNTYGPRWQRGVRYNQYGYGPTYVVNDYGYYGLRQPPRGYYWRRDNRGDFLLVAIASGIIADLILHGGY